MARKRKRPEVKASSRTAPADTFRVVVAAAPNGSLTIAPELELIKAALLYGDAVTVLSPVTTMLLRVSDLGRFDVQKQIGLIQRIAPYLMDAGEAAQFDSGVEQMLASLRKGRGRLTREDLILRGLLAQQISPIGNELAGVVEGLLENAGFNQLARARKEGMVEFESCDPGDDLDLIASCVIMAKLAETGQTPDEPRMESILDVFFGRLSVYLSSGRDYLLFDEQLASLMESAISLGLVRPAQGPTARSAQAMGASGLMGRLPTFPDATVDEVLDIRSDLDPLVANLRSAIVTVSRTFTSRPWESSFRDELHDSWLRQSDRRLPTSMRPCATIARCCTSQPDSSVRPRRHGRGS